MCVLFFLKQQQQDIACSNYTLLSFLVTIFSTFTSLKDWRLAVTALGLINYVLSMNNTVIHL